MEKEPRQSYLPYDPEFELSLRDALKDASETKGKYTIRDSTHKKGVKCIDYWQATTARNLRDEEWTTTFEFPPEESTNNLYINTTKRFISAMNQANTLQKYLVEPDLPPERFGNILHHTLRILPDLHILNEGKYTGPQVVPPVTAIIRENVFALMRQYTQYEPTIAAPLMQATANQLSQSAPTSPFIQRYSNSMVNCLKAAVAEDRRAVSKSDVEINRSQYVFAGPHVEQNIAQAIDIFDKAGLIPPDFWRTILNTPLTSQSYLVTTLLAEKLQSQDASAIIGDAKGFDRLRMIENAAGALVQRAARHTARDQSQLRIIREAIATDARNRSDKVSLGKAVKLADTVIRREYPNQLSGLRPEDSFAGAGQAMSFLLRITLRPDASQEEKHHANQEAETYLDIIKALAEYAQEPIIRTVGDLALRYANASGKELEALQKAFFSGGTKKSDALRHQQRLARRRHSITKPGYGIIS